MPYDADHRRRILEEVRSACKGGKFEHAAKVLQQATANLSLKNRRLPVRLLRAELGASCADQLVKWCTVQPCMFCKAGRDTCEECRGKGEEKSGNVCDDCGGLGSRRCSFCNGTAFAGYDFVPVGLRVVVMTGRMRLALARIAELRAKVSASAPDTAQIIQRLADLERCRGVLANACERVRMGDVTTPGEAVFSHSTAVRIESTCRAANARAEAIVRRLLKSLASHGNGGTGTASPGSHGKSISPARAMFFAKLAASDNLAPSALETPWIFRDS